MINITKTFSYTGTTQTFIVPSAVTTVFIQAWGAAGGSVGGSHIGGSGGYSQGYLIAKPYDTLNIIVGQGGINYPTSSAQAKLPTFGGGGGGGPCNEQFVGSSGGGRSAVRLSNNTEIITAGGGGGSDSSNAEPGVSTCGGPGGGLIGADAYISIACYNIAMGKGGTQVAGGTGGTGWTAFNMGVAGTQFTGGTGGGGSNGGGNAGSGGGGGGGYYGGGGGAGEFQQGLGCPVSPGAQDCAAGGGSSYIGGVLNGLTSMTAIPAVVPTTFTPPYSTDPNYVAGVGVARYGGTGNGLVVLSYTVPTLTKSVDKGIVGIGDTITYTAVFDNTSGVTLNNLVFVDTIPNGATFVSNSLVVNSTTLAGSPSSPGINIGNYSTIVTISYKVVVTSIPTPNPIPNVASIAADNLTPTISNTVYTQTNYLYFQTSKTVSKSYARVGDVLTYTIPIKNTGNSTANNIIFIDTIPSGTTYVASSLKQDGTTISNSSNPPGVTLPNSIGPSKFSTITFQVVVNTIPTINPIPNSAAITASFTIDNTTTPNRIGNSSSATNIVNTQINNATLSGISKSVNKRYAVCGETLMYLITIPNSGNVTASNVVFKDTLPNGTSLVANSVTVGGITQPGANPQTGVNIGSIGPNQDITITFTVTINC